MIDASQCRAARALLGWTQPDLSRETGLSVVTVRAFERGGEMRDSNRNLLELTFARAGVVFDLEAGQGRGVRFKDAEKPRPAAGDHPKPSGPATDAVERMEAEIAADRGKHRQKS